MEEEVFQSVEQFFDRGRLEDASTVRITYYGAHDYSGIVASEDVGRRAEYQCGNNGHGLPGDVTFDLPGGGGIRLRWPVDPEDAHTLWRLGKIEAETRGRAS